MAPLVDLRAGEWVVGARELWDARWRDRLDGSAAGAGDGALGARRPWPGAGTPSTLTSTSASTAGNRSAPDVLAPWVAAWGADAPESGVSAADSGVATRVLALQCGAGVEAVAAIAAGVQLVGLDISSVAVEAARRALEAVRDADAETTDEAWGSRFVVANVYAARHLLPEPDSFDVVVTSRAALESLPELEEWARVVEWFLAPSGALVVGGRRPSDPAWTDAALERALAAARLTPTADGGAVVARRA
ncbi:hypothetical protein FM119_06075 [Mycetocola reblochoni REB411]|uniref:Methyltransferase type 12 domain-containing protein n=1 Tax=Mycetocola reblochoni REB411 TaxID=1255698 RepID=A0A1R4J9Q2_9MICO|nr:hypothetical protein FM119_06075 [Mycetocola reblochoni REB411]